MIRVAVRLDANDVVTRLQASGHAGGTRGNDIVCAAASTLLRTFARTLENHSRVAITGGAKQRGEMSVRIGSYDAEDRSWLAGITGFLIQGLTDLSSDFPDRCEIVIESGIDPGQS
jgi:uncharacterized protein YsxB (DUF464 family)